MKLFSILISLFTYIKYKILYIFNPNVPPIGLNNCETFRNIYKKNFWESKETVSGPGSEQNSTQKMIHQLNSLLIQYEIDSINDFPCGDFNWMKSVNLNNIRYLGGDVVLELIEFNNNNYKKDNVNFRLRDFILDELPAAKLILSRDALVHFSFNDINQSLLNFKKSNSKYLLTTHFPNCVNNINIKTGFGRPVNFEIEPFNFPSPIAIIHENKDFDQNFKTLALWKLEEI